MILEVFIPLTSAVNRDVYEVNVNEVVAVETKVIRVLSSYNFWRQISTYTTVYLKDGSTLEVLEQPSKIMKLINDNLVNKEASNG